MAKIDRVTITGADDTTDPAELLRLSKMFPFVEWGILFGAGVKRQTQWGQGKPRFPSHPWVAALIRSMDAERMELNLSFHLCGQYVYDATSGRGPRISERSWRRAQRIQLNFHAAAHDFDHNKLMDVIGCYSYKAWIFQLDGVNDRTFEEIHKMQSVAVPLFDRSGGAGVVPRAWPAPYPGVYCGYAGGLGPDNLEEEIARIDRVAAGERIWLDMETRVRNDADTKLDIDRVEKALEVCAPHVLR